MVATSERHDETSLHMVPPPGVEPGGVCDSETRHWFARPFNFRRETTTVCEKRGNRGPPRYVSVSDGKTLTQHWPEDDKYSVCPYPQQFGPAIHFAVEWPRVEGSVAIGDDGKPRHTLEVAGTEEVSGRKTWVVERTPIGELEISARIRGFEGVSRFWLDAETFLPLKREYYLDDGSLLWRETVTEISYNVPLNGPLFELPLPPGIDPIC